MLMKEEDKDLAREEKRGYTSLKIYLQFRDTLFGLIKRIRRLAA